MMYERSPSPDTPPVDDIDRHPGTPMTTLGEVRRDHNLVAAYEDAGRAREVILELEQGGVPPRDISLLGAWPVERPSDEPERPRLLGRRVAIAAGIGAVVFGIVGGIVAAVTEVIPLVFGALAGAGFGALLGVPVGWMRGTGMSEAWQETFSADAEGTVAVGVHDDDAGVIDDAEPVMAATNPKAMNRF
ncbi:MAG: hypothetical protein AB1Z55_01825 [Acidimicrobiia bacterium]